MRFDELLGGTFALDKRKAGFKEENTIEDIVPTIPDNEDGMLLPFPQRRTGPPLDNR